MARASKLNTSHQHHCHGQNSMVQQIAATTSHRYVCCVHVMILLVFTLHKHYIKHSTHTSSHRKPKTPKFQRKNIATPKPKIQPFECPKLKTKILSFLHPQNPNQNPFFFQIIKPQNETKSPNPQTCRQ